MLIVVSGLPGTGKSAVADALADQMRIPVFTKDRIEASLWRTGVTADLGSWQAAEDLLGTLAGEQLRRGQSAILDTVARTYESREKWLAIAAGHGAAFRPIECVCTDEAVHRSRIEGRQRGIPGWYELTWKDVDRARERWEPWTSDRLVLDAVDPLDANVARARAYVSAGAAPLPRTRDRATDGR
jgi:predicted kinase